MHVIIYSTTLKAKSLYLHNSCTKAQWNLIYNIMHKNFIAYFIVIKYM